MEPNKQPTVEPETEQSQLSKPATGPSSQTVLLAVLAAAATLLAIVLYVANQPTTPEPLPTIPPPAEQPVAVLSSEELDTIRQALPHNTTKQAALTADQRPLTLVTDPSAITPQPNTPSVTVVPPREIPKTTTNNTDSMSFGETKVSAPSKTLAEKSIFGMVFISPKGTIGSFVLSTQAGPYNIIYNQETSFFVGNQLFLPTALKPGDMLTVTGLIALGDTQFNANQIELTGTIELPASH